MNSLKNKMTRWDKAWMIIQFILVGMSIEFLVLAFFILA